MTTTDGAAPTIPSYDETTLCAPAFRVLKTMVATWLKEVSAFKNRYADYLLIHFYRWLRSTSSYLYDPALRRILHNYSKKLFVQLIAELQRMGSIIVFADFTKIILCTKKKDAHDAYGYVQYIIQSILNKELFHSIHFEIRYCWDLLVWLDLSNHAGIRLTSLTSNEESNHSDNNETEFIMNWSMVDYIPIELCQDTFNKTISAYFAKIYTDMKDKSAEEVTKRAKEFLTGEISQKLFQYVQSIYKKFPEKVLTIEEYPHLNFDDQSKKITLNPALELSKAICKVLSLDPQVETEVSSLHINLLRLIDVGSFSDKAEWKDPCLSFILPEILCDNCNHVRDIDLCKDSYKGIEENKHVWRCSNCDLIYDNDQIEFSLIDILNRKTMGYAIQDVKCNKCNEVKPDNVISRCSCSGYFKTITTKDNLTKILKIFRSISAKCQMSILAESVEFMLTKVN